MRAVLLAGVIAAAGAWAADAGAETIRVAAGDDQSLIALVGEPVRRRGTTVTARIVSAHRALAGYRIDLVEYDCAFMKYRLVEYRRYDAAGALQQSYDAGEWGGVYADNRGDVMRAYLCTATGNPTVVQAASAAAFAQDYVAGRWSPR